MSTAAIDSLGFLTKLKERREVAERTMAFYFEKPGSFRFTPGQFLDITLQNSPETDSEGDTRGFSIASAPYEDFIMVATRLRDTAFKRVLSSASIGAKVKIEGPFGSLKLHNNQSRAAVILTGGIGITPFRSILLDAAMKSLPHQISLFYSNRRPEDAAFLDELKELEVKNPRYQLIACMTDMKKSSQPWDGEVGKITPEMVEKYTKGLTSPVYYVTGPPSMVNAMHTMLLDTGVDDDDIRIEEFAGY